MSTPTPVKRIFAVHPLDAKTFIELISEISPGNSVDDISNRVQPDYLHRYLKSIGVKTVVVEYDYVDRDYLEDFASYYVKCFKEYPRRCGRLHFFDIAFDSGAFESVLSGSTADLTISKLQEGYCGFVVIKPLPQTIIGRTVLRTYPESSTRAFPAARRFDAHLFGISLHVSRSLPFQEQDNVVAACATSALWSVFQATAIEFRHALLTPVEITRAATEQFPADTRMIPNRGGLSTPMMAHAIRAVGLEPLLLALRPTDDQTIRANVYAYLAARIPILMGLRLYDLSRAKGAQAIGLHAVALTGYNLKTPVGAAGGSGFQLKATRIDKLYAHDDQVGPFARMIFDGVTVDYEHPDKSITQVPSMSTSWRAMDGSLTKVRAVPTMLLIPLYHKIRIPYEDAYGLIRDFDDFFDAIRKGMSSAAPPAIEWDIRIGDVNQVKHEILIDGAFPNSKKLHWLTDSMPRFLWRASGILPGNAKLFDVLLDATDIHTSDGVHAVFVYDPTVEAVLRSVATHPSALSLPVIPSGARKILEWLSKNPGP